MDIYEQETSVYVFLSDKNKKHKVCLTNFRILLILSYYIYVYIYIYIYIYI